MVHLLYKFWSYDMFAAKLITIDKNYSTLFNLEVAGSIPTTSRNTKKKTYSL